MVRFADRQKLVGAADSLKGLSQITHWDAVDGYFGLAFHINGDAEAVSGAVSAIDGFTELSRCDNVDDISSLSNLPDDQSHSYLLIEADPNTQETLCARLRELKSVSHCLSTTGDYNLIAIVTGESFDIIARTIRETIRPLDGILRLRQNRIIGLSN